MTKAQQIVQDALKLPRRSRGQVLEALLESLEPIEDPEAAALWEKEVARRVKLDDQGKLKYISMEASIADLRKRARR
jgi:hypothetical protein